MNRTLQETYEITQQPPPPGGPAFTSSSWSYFLPIFPPSTAFAIHLFWFSVFPLRSHSLRSETKSSVMSHPQLGLRRAGVRASTRGSGVVRERAERGNYREGGGGGRVGLGKGGGGLSRSLDAAVVRAHDLVLARAHEEGHEDRLGARLQYLRQARGSVVSNIPAGAASSYAKAETVDESSWTMKAALRVGWKTTWRGPLPRSRRVAPWHVRRPTASSKP